MTRTRLDALVGDMEVETLLSDAAEIEAMLAFEGALAEAEADAGLIPAEAAAAIAAARKAFEPDAAALARGMASDGVVGPAFVAALRARVGEPHSRWLHRGATSQDAVDTALVLRLRRVATVLDARLAALLATLGELRAGQGTVPLMAHTRMQRALPVTAADTLDAWARPLARHRARLAELAPRFFAVQFGGPVGTRTELDGQGDAVVDGLARRLGLGAVPPWQSARDTVVEFGDWLSLVSGALGKIGQDLALMAQNEVAAVWLAGGGASSAMPHKANPVGAEVLVALARFNAGLAGTLHNSLVHENERSGAAWTLEWMVLPRMAVATGASLRHAASLLDGLRFLAAPAG